MARPLPSPDLRCGWPPPLPHVDGRVRHRRLPLLVVRPPGPDLRWCPRPSLACGGAAPPLPDSNGNGAAPAFPRRPAGGAAGVRLGLLQGGGGGGHGGGWFFLFIPKIICRVLVDTRQTLFAECPNIDPRQICLCRPIYAVWGLPCITHGKLFAVCNTAFAVCFWHTANVAHPVVRATYSRY